MNSLSQLWPFTTLAGSPLMLAAAGQPFLETALHPMAVFGWLGQPLFFSRFLVQWFVSERERRSTVPVAFWYLSLSGGILFLIYALWRHDLILSIGQGVGLFVYLRNLVLIGREQVAADNAVGHV